MNRAFSVAFTFVMSLAFSGCINQRITEPKRTATEQLLISTAADRALEQVNVNVLEGKKVFLDTTYFESLDEKYVIGSIRDMLFRNGVLVTPTANESEFILEARSGALSIDGADTLTGIPSLAVPIPLAGVTKTPEVAIFKSQKQDSTARIALLAYQRESLEHTFSTIPMVGKAYTHYYQLLGFIKFQMSDIPEKKYFKRGED